jgi:hypothetical protein
MDKSVSALASMWKLQSGYYKSQTLAKKVTITV